MPTRADADGPPRRRATDDPDILLVMVPGMGMTADDFDTEGLISAVEQRHASIAVTTVDPGLDGYLDGSIETLLLADIIDARRTCRPGRVWLAGISLGCQAILRCVRAQPDLAEGVILITPYLASTGLIGEIAQTNGLRDWAAANVSRTEPERALLTWLATTPLSRMPRLFLGRALGDRFAMTANLLADILPSHHVVTVPGAHDWTSWRALWRLILDRHPFEPDAAAVS